MTVASADAILIERLALGGDGPTVAVKDTLDIAGYPTRAASPALADAPAATANADVVERVLAAGCRIVGRANMHELAFGVTGINRLTGTALNTHWPDRIPGGSSSGSAAAVAAGLCDFALGSDTGGSIRIPACCCGVVGIKPTWGRVSRRGAQPPHSSLDCVGPFATSVAMLTRAMEIIDPTFRAATLDRAPVLGRLAVAATAEIDAAVDGALAGCGVTPIAAEVPGFEEAYAAGLTVINVENWAAFAALTASPALGEDIRGRLFAGRDTPAQAVAAAEEIRARVTAEVDAALAGVDALVLPTMADVPPKLEEAGDARRLVAITSLVRPFNLTGHPALTLPIVTAGGLPAGIQLVGRKGDDALLCAIAARLEAAMPSAFAPPPVSTAGRHD